MSTTSLDTREGSIAALSVTARYEFEAAHRLEVPAHSDEANARDFGMCNRLHGHNYRLHISVAGSGNVPSELERAMVMDFGDLDGIVEDRVLSKVEHQFLNDLQQFAETPTTAETVAAWIWAELDGPLAEKGVTLTEVLLFESDKYSARFQRTL